MSISRSFDDYLDDSGIIPSAEVVPDDACQVFLDAPGVKASVVSERDTPNRGDQRTEFPEGEWERVTHVIDDILRS